MKWITINSLKGGSGKTTLALNLYYHYTSQKKKVGLIDADLQGSLSDIVDEKEETEILKREEFGNWDELKGISGFDIVLVDTGPYMETDDLLSIFHLSDFVLIPCKASTLDLNANIQTIAHIKESQRKNKKLKAALVLTMGIHSTVLNSEWRPVAESFGLPVLASEMLNRVDYARSIDEPKAIFSTDNVKARNEIRKIGIEILNLMK